ncbi:uncharacterized protein [Panulirus ornatus]|uniref:uncharacterized protein n=1 Tax=Panulirus ornatus TaxID=150431 RepID=UPI003A8570C5
MRLLPNWCLKNTSVTPSTETCGGGGEGAAAAGVYLGNGTRVDALTNFRGTFTPSKSTRTHLTKALVTAAGVMAVGVGAYLSRDYVRRVLRWVAVQEAWVVVLVFLGLFTLVSLPFMWGYIVVNVSAGYMFGTWRGLAVTITTATAGVLLAHVLIRVCLREVVHRRVVTSRLLRALLDVLGGTQAFKVVAVTRLTPIPFGLQNAVFAVSGVPTWLYLAATVLGLLPTQVLNCYLGTTVRNLDDVVSQSSSASATGWGVFAAQIVISIGLTMWVVRRAKAELRKTMIAQLPDTEPALASSSSPAHAGTPTGSPAAQTPIHSSGIRPQTQVDYLMNLPTSHRTKIGAPPGTPPPPPPPSPTAPPPSTTSPPTPPPTGTPPPMTSPTTTTCSSFLTALRDAAAARRMRLLPHRRSKRHLRRHQVVPVGEATSDTQRAAFDTQQAKDKTQWSTSDTQQAQDRLEWTSSDTQDTAHSDTLDEQQATSDTQQQDTKTHWATSDTQETQDTRQWATSDTQQAKVKRKRVTFDTDEVNDDTQWDKYHTIQAKDRSQWATFGDDQRNEDQQTVAITAEVMSEAEQTTGSTQVTAPTTQHTTTNAQQTGSTIQTPQSIADRDLMTTNAMGQGRRESFTAIHNDKATIQYITPSTLETIQQSTPTKNKATQTKKREASVREEHLLGSPRLIVLRKDLAVPRDVLSKLSTSTLSTTTTPTATSTPPSTSAPTTTLTPPNTPTEPCASTNVACITDNTVPSTTAKPSTMNATPHSTTTAITPPTTPPVTTTSPPSTHTVSGTPT